MHQIKNSFGRNKVTTAPSRAWKFPTSPRSPYKIKPELKLLKVLENKDWNKSTQLEFAKLLQQSEDYRGEVSEKETDFAARDRLRGPSTLGFIKKPDGGMKNLTLTTVGNIFVNCELHEEEFIFQRQIAKVQFGSPANRKSVEKDMNVRPLGLMVYFLKELKQITKEEMALYCITTIDYREAEKMVTKIKENRSQINSCTDIGKRKKLRISQRIKRLEQVYKTDLNTGNTQLREGGDNFLETKYRTLRDFADSSFRYFIATGLFSINFHGQTFEIVKARSRESDFLLDRYGMSIDNDPNASYSSYLDLYLGNADALEIWRDQDENQVSDIKRLIEFIYVKDKVKGETFKIQYKHSESKIKKLALLNDLENESMLINRIAHSREI